MDTPTAQSLPTEKLPQVTLYTDGACTGNPGPGGYGIVLISGKRRKELSGGFRLTTNNRMELLACIMALEAIKDPALPVAVFTDSAYLHNCLAQKWYRRWQKNGWLTAGKKPVENRDLWTRLLALQDAFPRLGFHKVAGHSHIELNERADQLAKEAIRNLG